jgi:hypothetical protein
MFGFVMGLLSGRKADKHYLEFSQKLKENIEYYLGEPTFSIRKEDTDPTDLVELFKSDWLFTMQRRVGYKLPMIVYYGLDLHLNGDDLGLLVMDGYNLDWKINNQPKIMTTFAKVKIGDEKFDMYQRLRRKERDDEIKTLEDVISKSNLEGVIDQTQDSPFFTGKLKRVIKESKGRLEDLRSQKIEESPKSWDEFKKQFKLRENAHKWHLVNRGKKNWHTENFSEYLSWFIQWNRKNEDSRAVVDVFPLGKQREEPFMRNGNEYPITDSEPGVHLFFNGYSPRDFLAEEEDGHSGNRIGDRIDENAATHFLIKKLIIEPPQIS